MVSDHQESEQGSEVFEASEVLMNKHPENRTPQLQHTGDGEDSKVTVGSVEVLPDQMKVLPQGKQEVLNLSDPPY